MAFKLPELEYSFNALQPHIDAKTMEIHHGKHHAAYVANLNKALEGTPETKYNLEEIIENISNYPVAVRNNGGGHYNHTFFWKILSPKGGGQPTGLVGDIITKEFGSFDAFKNAFSQAAMTRFGSGWAWLCLDNEGKLFVTSTPNQDNPLMDIAALKGKVLLGIDVWEHAYYLNYQNRRADYIEAFWNIVNWNKIEGIYKEILK